ANRSGRDEVRRSAALQHGDDAFARELGHAQASGPGRTADVREQRGGRRGERGGMHLRPARGDVDARADETPFLERVRQVPAAARSTTATSAGESAPQTRLVPPETPPR